MARCSTCGRTYGLDDVSWRCTCGGVLELEPTSAFDRQSIESNEPGFWRYAAALPHLGKGERLRLGEVVTPLVETRIAGVDVLLKLDYLTPSGSYKDRGAAVLVSILRKNGIREMFDDSSGNAGAAAAAYAAAASIDCTILVPAHNSPAKLEQISAYGAHVLPIEGTRLAVAEAAKARASTSSFYASHVWHPLYPAGVATVGFEIWEQLGFRAPSALLVPAGQGSLVLGLARAFDALSSAGAIRNLPAIFAVQSRAFPTLAMSFASLEPQPDGASDTVAEGIACSKPLREAAVIAALRRSGGRAIAVEEVEILDALAALVRAGFYVEPTGAVAAAALNRVSLDVRHGGVVVVLTGSGLKAGGQIARIMSQIDRQASVRRGTS